MRCAALFLVLLLVAGCGTKGPLYFRDAPPPGVKPPRTEEPYKPVPYPADATRDAEKSAGDEAGAGATKK
jgi:predicted small lipoprotein YifL